MTILITVLIGIHIKFNCLKIHVRVPSNTECISFTLNFIKESQKRKTLILERSKLQSTLHCGISSLITKRARIAEYFLMPLYMYSSEADSGV